MGVTLGKKLCALRINHQYTQQQISDYLHIERAAYVNYEKDRRTPSYDTLMKVAKFYNINVEYLINPDFTGNIRTYPCEAEQMIKNFCQLTPEVQEFVVSFVNYCAAR